MKRAALVIGTLALLLLALWAYRNSRRAGAPGAVPLSAPEPSALYRSKAPGGFEQPLSPAQASGQAAPSQGGPSPVDKSQEPAASPAAQAPSRPAHSLKPTEILAELNAILESGDDSDPRLDKDFNALQPETKRLFRQRYAQAPAEERNTRGTIVLLLSGNLDAPEDWAFLRSVVNEPPCLSLDDCAHRAPASKHQESGMRVTLAYPQMVALKQVEGRLEETRQPGVQGQGATVSQAISVLRVAKASPEPTVSEMAGEIATRFGLAL